MRPYLALILILLAGCMASPLETRKTTNSELTVNFLFENDGCKVYRFYDGGRNIYYTDCSGGVQFSVQEGKTSHEENVATKGKCK